MTTRAFQVVSASEPGSVLGEVTFTPAAEGSRAGTTGFRTANPAGEVWMILIQEMVRSTELLVLVPDEPPHVGPHDRDLLHLQAALAVAVGSYPVQIIGLDPARAATVQQVDALVECTKELLREALIEAAGRRPWPRQVEEVMRALAGSRVGVRDLAGLRAHYADFMDAVARGGDAAAPLFDAATHNLRRWLHEGKLADPGLVDLLDTYTRHRVVGPNIVY